MQQVLLMNIWVLFVWPINKRLFPQTFGTKTADKIILGIVMVAGLTSSILSFVPSFIQMHTSGIKSVIIWPLMFAVGVLLHYFAVVFQWYSATKPRNVRDIIITTFISSGIQLLVVLLLFWVDALPVIGFSSSITDVFKNVKDALIDPFDTASYGFLGVASFIVFLAAYIISCVLPAKAYVMSLTSPVAFIIFLSAFGSFFNNEGMIIQYVFSSLSLGFLSTCFWGFLESRIRWQARLLRGQIRLPKESPMPKASWISRLGFCWNVGLLKYGYQNKLEEEDISNIVASETVEHSYTKFRHQMKDPSINSNLLKVFSKTIGRDYFYALGCFVLFLACHLFTPSFLLKNLLLYLDPNTNYPKSSGLLYVIGLFLSSAIGSICYQHGWHWAVRCGIRARTAFIMAVYDKILTVKKLQSVGEVVNFLANDSSRIIESVRFGWWLILAPISLIVISVIVSVEIGPIALVGAFILFAQVPLQLFIGTKIGHVRARAVTITDDRVKIMNDVLSSIKTVKLYCWEKPFSEQVAEIREREGKELRTTATVKYINVAISYLSPVLATFICLSLSYALDNNSLTASKIFTISSLFNASSAPLAILPMAIANLAQGMIGLKRLQALLGQEDLRDNRILNTSRNPGIKVKNGTFSYDLSSDREDEETDEKIVKRNLIEESQAQGSFMLQNINFSCSTKGKLIAIVGKVGTGKSCLLAAISGQLPSLEGTVEVNGSLAYLTQTGLLVNATVRDNILFGEPYDEDKYRRTIEACELLSDFKNLPNGDQTEVGEKGATLSGGQKARVGLARAVYANKDIYLLDDPLSAVDSRVGHRMFENCMRGALKDKIVLLVTNQPQYLPGCDEILVLNGGRIILHGTYDEIKDDEEFSQLLTVTQKDKSKAKEEKKKEKEDAPPEKEIREHVTLVEDEDSSSGGVGLGTLAYYCFAGGKLAPILLAIFFIIVQLNRVAADFMLSLLGKPDVVIPTILIVYSVLVIVYAFLLIARAMGFSRVAINSSTSIHNIVFYKVLKAPPSFFETNPLGRILNRFSRDLDVADGRLPDFFIDAFVFVIHCVSIVIVICTVIPWFLFIVGLMAVAFWLLTTYYQRSARELKRLDSVTSSPIFAHLSMSISGVPTIRAYNAQERFRQDNKDKINANTKAFFAFEAITNWLGLCLDLLAAVVITLVGLLTVVVELTPDTGGLVLSYSLMMTAAFQYAVRTATETENLLVAIERLQDYAENLSQEGVPEEYRMPSPPVDWPNEGGIVFKDVVVKYRPELEPVLKKISFQIKPKEKIGIVGRTGAGKSTLTQVLFRMIEPAGGDIKIDGRSIINMDLPDLRSKLACIPQDPVLFVGTIRTNLDPFNNHTDERIWDALDRVHMKNMVNALPGALEYEIREGGTNFSLGQRQLICIARALLRNSKILVMDEATAAIDMESDQLIQRTIRSSFADVTILCIAHRLQTIMDYDRIMVVDSGGIAEFASPKELLENENGIFYQMYHQH